MVLYFGVVEVRVINIVWSSGILWSTVIFGVLEGVGVGVSGGIWWLVGVLYYVSSSSGNDVIVICELRHIWYCLLFLVILAICRCCLLVWLFLAVVALMAVYF